MQKPITIKICFFGMLFVWLILVTNNANAAMQQTNNWLDELISISFQNESLSTVLKQISQQTGVAIAYDQELANEKVTGNYKNVKTSDAITRLFKSKNKSIQVNKEKKVIIVKTFGAKSFIWAGTIQGKNTSSQMTLAELEKMHTQQYKEYKDRIADDNEILEGGITQGELRVMHKKQYKEYKERMTSENETFEDNITHGELRAMHKQQYQEYNTRLSNYNEKIEGDITQRELQNMHTQQHTSRQARTANSDYVIEDGVTRGELIDMHKKQQKAYEKRKKDEFTIAE